MDYEGWARLYDALVQSSDDLDFFVELSTRAPGRVLELMAGTGRVSVPVAAAGVDLTCVDRSRAMLDVLRGKLAKRRLRATVVEQSVTELDLEGEFALAFIAFNSFEELASDSDRTSAINAIYHHLAPGGTAVITLHDPQVLLRATGGRRAFEQTFEDPETGREVVIRHSAKLDKKSNVMRGNQELIWAESGVPIAELSVGYRLTTRREFEALAADAGFNIEALNGDYSGAPYREGVSAQMIWILRRRSNASESTSLRPV